MKGNVKLQTEKWVMGLFKNDSTGHDWYHTDRVRKNAIHIGEKEGANLFVCEMAALLHDVADEKFNESEEEGLQKVEEWLLQQDVLEIERLQILSAIQTVSFKGGNNRKPATLEGKIVQDADRLDAIGAIGIARCFMYAGAYGDAMYHPDLLPRGEMTQEQYRNEQSTAINHFYEKLLKLKLLMNTETARKLAEVRHSYLENFLEEFLDEWNGLK
ncbi:HD domain-containing protein [Evansella sp. AB-P1]|uniref:HD domain-containing protein n=1 Tax=Evansella sp. AB-P1 TaxID=3037653 RepID=UPI00241BFFA0|nr:HD domain-containing protein [Evansella sp. AB-P1]MDG5789942.1 HD domain-containing protein [Evansella sp. AB-P1]